MSFSRCFYPKQLSHACIHFVHLGTLPSTIVHCGMNKVRLKSIWLKTCPFKGHMSFLTCPALAPGRQTVAEVQGPQCWLQSPNILPAPGWSFYSSDPWPLSPYGQICTPHHTKGPVRSLTWELDVTKAWQTDRASTCSSKIYFPVGPRTFLQWSCHGGMLLMMCVSGMTGGLGEATENIMKCDELDV